METKHRSRKLQISNSQYNAKIRNSRRMVPTKPGDFSDEIAANSQTPSEKLKKDPIMALVTKTVSTYMLVKHSKNAKKLSKEDNLSPWGEPFFKKKE